MSGGADTGSSSVWGITSDEMRNAVQRFFLPTKDVSLVRKPRTAEMEGDMWLALAVWLVLVLILYKIVVRPFLDKRREGLVIDDSPAGDAGKTHRE